jgi:hypothetical protein
MSIRKVTVKVKKEDLSEVIENLKAQESEITLTLSLPDSKDIYKYLSTSDKVLDWEFLENEQEMDVKEVDKEIEEKKDLDVFSEFVYNVISGPTNLSEGISSFIEATWRVNKKSPGIIFGTPLFIITAGNELGSLSSGPSIEKAVLYKVIEAYYNGFSKIDIVSDLCDKIRGKWKEISKCETLTNVSILLFRNA